MTASAYSPNASGFQTLVPQATAAPGELLWGEAPRRQPIAPLILMAVLLLLVAAPSAMGGNGGSSNPITLMKQIANSTYDLTTLMTEANHWLSRTDENTKRLAGMQESMDSIAAATNGMAEKTTTLNETLGSVGGSVTASRKRLDGVNAKLARTSDSMGGLRTSVSKSATSTKAVVGEFDKIDAAISSMDTNLTAAITLMAKSAPLTTEFANNRTRVAIAGGDAEKFDVPNFAPNNRVMSVVLPMISIMQKGGSLPARKDRHVASNPLINLALRSAVPDGSNVVAQVLPFDGHYGLPGEQFFVKNRIHGF